MPRKTDSNNPSDWIFFAESDITGLRLLANSETAYSMCVSKLAEVLEKVLKAELIRLGWFLEKTHDIQKLAGELAARESDLIDQIRPLCNDLAEKYFIDRYPGFDLEDPDWPGLREQLEHVSTLVEMDFGSPPLAAVQRQEWEQLAALSTRYHLSKDRLNELAEKALAELEKSQIGTIHSFAAHLLRIYPVETGVDPAFLEDEGSNFKEYFKQEWAAWLDRELGPAGANKEIWRAVLRVVSLEDLRELAVKLAGELIPLDDLLVQGGAP